MKITNILNCKFIITLITFCIFLIGCSDKDDKIEISSKNLHPILYNKDGLNISVEKCEYTQGESDLEITLNVENKTKKTISIDFTDVHIGDTTISNIFDTDPYEPGENVSSSYYFSYEDIKENNIEEFDEMNCTLSISTENKELVNSEVVIKYDAFVENNYEYDEEDNQVTKSDLNINDKSENKNTYIESDEKNIEEQNNSTVYDAYIEAININKEELVESQLSTTYHGIKINEEELQYLESGAIYRSLARKIEGFYMDFSKNNYEPNNTNDKNSMSFICGIEEQPTWEEMKVYVDKARLIVKEENALQSIMSTFQQVECISGNFDFDNNIYDFEIHDLKETSAQLGISEEMLGYTLALLEEYAPSVEFGKNSYKCTWFR